ncbi:pantothenate kinase [Sporobacter termitidis DSM 10068]|uniref:Type III pantothenate kinase n=1 Tax=Sporobacter termitidis DSM 10068 TaxID=1123282 RepID=A0A1M5UFT8_9FIRM|nr:type III pantothenate kinase [Sporobacter termitidis]SHH61884.1 pantothenate kinase [Sporobacter termitidis DSM 10068]
MLLAIDVGNSNIVIGCINGGEISHVFRMVTDISKTEFEYAVGIKNILEFEGIRCDGFEGAIVSSVVPPLLTVLKSAVRSITGKAALIVGAGIKTGLNILIDDPGQLGSDLVADGVAAISTYKLPVIVFDMGTATTISVIDAHGNYLGGVLYPGVALSMNALSTGTSQLPKVPIEPPEKVINANSIDCMKSGAIFGTASMVDGMIDRIEAELGQKCTVVATGGLSGRIAPYCRHEIIHDENLLLRGLGIIYEKNKKTK